MYFEWEVPILVSQHDGDYIVVILILQYRRYRDIPPCDKSNIWEASAFQTPTTRRWQQTSQHPATINGLDARTISTFGVLRRDSFRLPSQLWAKTMRASNSSKYTHCLPKMMDTFLIAPACTQTCCKLHAFWECYIKCVCSPQKKKNNAPEHFAGGDCESALAAERRLRSDWTFLFDSTHVHSNFAQLTPNDPKRPQNMVQG